MIKDGERIDDLQLSNLHILQHPGRFCFGMDAVLLSGFATAKSGANVLDLCTGTGIVPILMEVKTQADHFSALEIQEESADMARRSVSMNGQENKISIITGDVKEASRIFGAASFDVVTVNPPYMTDGHGLTNPSLPKAIARHELLCTLDDVIRESAACLRPGGHFFMVHRPFRLTEIILTLTRYHLEPKRLRFVHPQTDSEPNMLLLEAVRGGKSRILVEPPLIVWSAPMVYSQEMRDHYGY